MSVRARRTTAGERLHTQISPSAWAQSATRRESGWPGHEPRCERLSLCALICALDGDLSVFFFWQPSLPQLNAKYPKEGKRKFAARKKRLLANSPCQLQDQALPRYCPVRVSILIVSPSLMNSGTLIFLPVSSVAGLVTLLAVSPRTPSGDSITFRFTDAGSSTCTGRPSA